MRTKKGNKEQDIINAAIEVFAREGYHKAKISRIAAEAGIATGSVYLYFTSKEEILQTIFKTIWRKLAEDFRRMTRRTNLSPLEKLEGMIDLLFDTFANQPSLAMVFVNEQEQLLRMGSEDIPIYYRAFMELGERVIRDGIRDGSFSQSFDASVLRHFIFGGIRHLMRQWAQDPDALPLLSIRNGIKHFFRCGVLENAPRA
jgi:TetR/AcrR family transcriptional regulator, fatty acid metabolism regulator protein